MAFDTLSVEEASISWGTSFSRAAFLMTGLSIWTSKGLTWVFTIEAATFTSRVSASSPFDGMASGSEAVLAPDTRIISSSMT